MLGASFANDQLAQLDAEFRLQEALAISQTYQGALKQEQAARELAELEIARDRSGSQFSGRDRGNFGH